MGNTVDMKAFALSGQIVEPVVFSVPEVSIDPNATAAEAVIGELEACTDPSARADLGMARALLALSTRK